MVRVDRVRGDELMQEEGVGLVFDSFPIKLVSFSDYGGSSHLVFSQGAWLCLRIANSLNLLRMISLTSTPTCSSER